MLEVYIYSSTFIISYLNGAICNYYTGDISVLHRIIHFSKTKQLIKEYNFTGVNYFDVFKEGDNLKTISLHPKEIEKRSNYIIPFIDTDGNSLV